MLPVGRINASEIFQRKMEEVFKDLIKLLELLIYIDDMLIKAKTTEQALESFEKVLHRCAEKNVELKL